MLITFSALIIHAKLHVLVPDIASQHSDFRRQRREKNAIPVPISLFIENCFPHEIVLSKNKAITLN